MYSIFTMRNTLLIRTPPNLNGRRWTESALTQATRHWTQTNRLKQTNQTDVESNSRNRLTVASLSVHDRFKTQSKQRHLLRQPTPPTVDQSVLGQTKTRWRPSIGRHVTSCEAGLRSTTAFIFPALAAAAAAGVGEPIAQHHRSLSPVFNAPAWSEPGPLVKELWDALSAVEFRPRAF